MTKTELIADFALATAPQEVQDEMNELMAGMPEELSDDMLKDIIIYATAAQDRETVLGGIADEAASAAEEYAMEVEDALESEDVAIEETLRNSMQAAQNLAA